MINNKDNLTPTRLRRIARQRKQGREWQERQKTTTHRFWVAIRRSDGYATVLCNKTSIGVPSACYTLLYGPFPEAYAVRWAFDLNNQEEKPYTRQTVALAFGLKF